MKPIGVLITTSEQGTQPDDAWCTYDHPFNAHAHFGMQHCIGTRTEVERVGEDEHLKLRAGPGLGFRVVLGLPDGTQLIQRDCVTESSQLWCRVSLAEAPTVSGYVSADYLATR